MSKNCVRTPDSSLKRSKNALIEFFKRLNLVPERYILAFKAVPREYFVLKKYRNWAYVDQPLPLIKGATISAPSMSLLLCYHAELDVGKRVLEIGTGSGYQAALITELVYPRNSDGTLINPFREKIVCTMEIDPELYELGKSNLKKTCYLDFIEIKLGDGTLGWPDKNAKFDAIIVTAAGKEIPPPLIKQLNINGVLIMPIGTEYWQVLVRIRKVGPRENDIKKEHLEDVRFVPLRGYYGL